MQLMNNTERTAPHRRSNAAAWLWVAFLSMVLLLAGCDGRRTTSTHRSSHHANPPSDSAAGEVATLGGEMAALRRVINMTYLRCVYHGQSLLRVPDPSVATTTTLQNHKFPYFAGSDGKPTWAWRTPETASEPAATTAANASSSLPPPQPPRSSGGHRKACTPRGNCSTNGCGFQWIEDSEAYSGLDSLIIVGDSTMLRLFMYVTRASDAAYQTRVQTLSEDHINRTVVLSSGRLLDVHFVRALHVSTAIEAVNRAFQLASRHSLIVFSFGPHDTSWLVFRRPMPGFKRSNVGNWHQARTYWNRFTTTLVHYIAFRLAVFEEFGSGYLQEYSLDGTPVNRRGNSRRRPDKASIALHRPVVVFREQYLANCAHPKYSKYPLITRCGDLLMPTVIPHYRAYLAAMATLVNIPTIGIDTLLQPPSSSSRSSGGGGRDRHRQQPPPLCHFVDAGHVNRDCNRYEVQLLMQAYRMTRHFGIAQGYVRKKHGALQTHLYKVLQQAGVSATNWGRPWELVREVAPFGYPSSMFAAPRSRDDIANASGLDGPLCAPSASSSSSSGGAEEPASTDAPSSLEHSRIEVSGQQMKDIQRLHNLWDQGTRLELDVLAMHRVDVHELRATRCARDHLWAPAFELRRDGGGIDVDGIDATSSTQDDAAGSSTGGGGRSPTSTLLTWRHDPSVWVALAVSTAVVGYLVVQVYGCCGGGAHQLL